VSLVPGSTFVIDPDGGTNPHLWIVLAVYEPELEYDEWALIVSVTTLDRAKFVDEACVLNVGDHPFLAHESFVHYQRTREVETRTLAACAANARQPCSPDLLKRLIEGLHRSPHTRRGHKSRVPRKT
jgi:hypothetical protein